MCLRFVYLFVVSVFSWMRLALSLPKISSGLVSGLVGVDRGQRGGVLGGFADHAA
jgi:hypothetical protein